MIIANTATGKTFRFDLLDETQCDALTTLIRTGHITALAILHRGVQTTLPLPKRFHKLALTFGFEVLRNGTRLPNGDRTPIGERVYCQAGDVRVSLSATFAGALVRCDVVKTGRQRFNPGRD